MPKNKVGYVDGFVLAVPKKKLQAYRRMAASAGKMWKKYGALDYKECVADDVKTKGAGVSFSKSVRLKTGEVVFFSYIGFKDRAHRDRVNAKVMKYPSMSAYQDQSMPFDMKRMLYGGFKVMVDS